MICKNVLSFWKFHIPTNTDLRNIIGTSNDGKNNIWLINEVIFQIWFGKNGKIEVPNQWFRLFILIIPELFFWNAMIVIGLWTADSHQSLLNLETRDDIKIIIFHLCIFKRYDFSQNIEGGAQKMGLTCPI